MQKNNIFYKILSSYFFYNLSQFIMSATSFRKKIISKIVKNKNASILDIGCGPAEIVEVVGAADYYGFDVNKNYINYAKKKYFDKKFFCSTFAANKIKKKKKFDYILLLGLLHHLSDKEAFVLFKEIKKVIKKNGVVVTLDNVYVKNQNFIAKKLIDLDRGRFVRNKTGYLNLLKSQFKIVNFKIYNQKFIPYTWFVTKSFI